MSDTERLAIELSTIAEPREALVAWVKAEEKARDAEARYQSVKWSEFLAAKGSSAKTWGKVHLRIAKDKEVASHMRTRADALRLLAVHLCASDGASRITWPDGNS